MLIPAWAQLVEKFPDWQLRIFGTGEKKAELRRLRSTRTTCTTTSF